MRFWRSKMDENVYLNRGCVAIGSIDKWTGVCSKGWNRPSAMGKSSWKRVSELYNKDIKQFAKKMLLYKTWEDFVDSREVKNNIQWNLKELITSEDCDPLFLDWVYVYNPEDKTLSILNSVFREQHEEPKKNVEKIENGYYDYGNVKCRHELLMTFDIDGPEPDWEAIEKMRE
jgi:hypothetical protein